MLNAALKQKVVKAAGTYVRAFIAAALAVYLSGNHDLAAIANAGLAAVIPVILRAINPGDGGYGFGSSEVSEPVEGTPAE